MTRSKNESMMPAKFDSMQYCATHFAGCNFRTAESVHQGGLASVLEEVRHEIRPYTGPSLQLAVLLEVINTDAITGGPPLRR